MPIQIGMPPETIKDSMAMGLTLPVHFIVPKERFNFQMGVSVAEFEFPAYYNFFLKRRKINLITTPDVEPLIRTIFTETLLGPETIESPTEYSESVPKEKYPDLKKEMSFFRVNPFDRTELNVDQLLSFTHFDDKGVAKLSDDVSIEDADTVYIIHYKGVEFARVSANIMISPPAELSGSPALSPTAASVLPEEDGEVKVKHFSPPHFGITMLGNSDGFDSKGTTTGFVLWMNRRGIMVDPPPHSGFVLRKYGIHPKLIKGVILTHCHADHDAGTFQKILEEGRVVVMSSPVILNSFLRKYSAISGLEPDFLKKLFVFRPVVIGEMTAVYGGYVQFFYSLHSIPCVGFAAYCNGKSMVYSADTYNDAPGIERLFERGLVSPGRRDALLNFPWHHNVILHEAGVPPIHTPMSTLEALPAEVKQRLFIVHKPPAQVLPSSGLKSALVGPENTIVISNQPSANGPAMEILDSISGIEFMSNFVISRAVEVLQCGQIRAFSPGQTIVHQGAEDSTLFVIVMGVVTVNLVEEDEARTLTVGDYFGEVELITGGKRTMTVKALTPVEVVALGKPDFLHLVRGTNTLDRLTQLVQMQRSTAWKVIACNSMLSQLTSAQKTYLMSIMHERPVAQGQALWTEGEEAKEAVLIADGMFVFSRASHLPPFRRGAFVGDMRGLTSSTPVTTSLICTDSGAVYYIPKHELLRFFDENPGVKVFFATRFFVE